MLVPGGPHKTVLLEARKCGREKLEGVEGDDIETTKHHQGLGKGKGGFPQGNGVAKVRRGRDT